tara:strand:- start:207 stop:1112 length:906 start_codon:yes stop_codon:yes gene_type:complete
VTSSLLITGASGFIGSKLNQDCKSLGINTTTLDISGEPEIISDISSINWQEIDLRNFDYVVHLAALTSVQDSINYPEEYFEVNSYSSRRLFEACAKNKVKKVIFASSAAVYGDSPEKIKRIGEEGPPSSPYAESKILAEKFAEEFASPETNFTCLRFFNVYGPNQREMNNYAAVIPSFINRISRGERVEIFGDGEQTRDFIHVDDVSRSIINSFRKELPFFAIMNIGSGEGTRIKNLAAMISNIYSTFNCESKPVFFRPARSGDVLHSVADVSDLSTLILPDPLIRMEDGLKDIIERTLDE